jgi:hypothetical protein
MKRLLTVLLSLAISGGAMYYLLRGDINTLQNEVQGGRYEYLIPALGIYIFSFITRAYRWQALLNKRVTLWHSFHIMMIGYLLSLLPLRLGEFARAYLTTRLDPPVKFFTSLSSIVIERVTDLLAVMILLGLSLLVLPVPSEVSAAGATLGIITIILSAVMLYFAHRREAAHAILERILGWLPFLKRFNFIGWLDHALDGLAPLTSKQLMGEVVFWTAASWILSIMTSYIIMLVFFESPSVAGLTLMLVLLALAVAIPSVPGNMGTFEAAAVAGLYFAGVIASTQAPDNAPAIAFAVLLHLLNLGSYFLGGVVGLYAEQISVGQVRRGVNQMNETEASAA